MGFLVILAPFLMRLRDLGVIFVGIYEAHIHTYFGYLFLVLSGFWISAINSVTAETGQNMAGWLLICSLSLMTISKHA